MCAAAHQRRRAVGRQNVARGMAAPGRLAEGVTPPPLPVVCCTASERGRMDGYTIGGSLIPAGTLGVLPTFGPPGTEQLAGGASGAENGTFISGSLSVVNSVRAMAVTAMMYASGIFTAPHQQKANRVRIGMAQWWGAGQRMKGR